MDTVYLEDILSAKRGSEERKHAINRARAYVNEKYGIDLKDPTKFLIQNIEESK